MRINEHTWVSTKKVLLAPYSAHHVPKYHEWMKDPEIQEATASEPLTLDEEYAMQRSWRTDADKLTFIICRPHDSLKETRDGRFDLDSMIGDVNLFISTTEDGCDTQIVIGELELMIAEHGEQNKGYGRAALLAFMNFIIRHEPDLLAEYHAPQSLGTNMQPTAFDHFAVKIGATNSRSIALFESLGFNKTSTLPSYFGEYELRLDKDGMRAFIDGDFPARNPLDGYRELSYSCS
ncbi:uncharacterized protein Z518_10488 [Rhinocladiella mackenziei CBS 650.93]|uniref:Rhinocladiella mackenziei CBS 650.93 unplaced genomic scaffold supercont1.9, whole genome shotgun sequence n=1 Tax=Rhinocladiella mackenziei CBS 650.93 TaxID=1442369 RepID=A0A0D2I3J7_9EURO|nr:uncharacterized protein Z518_10488 [Rhinocladiella mackenziei CBS 650.93]KIX00349.1 hypothetical protein Z518_10488 [Rhinocladiella mackenziei CBS 650.93]